MSGKSACKVSGEIGGLAGGQFNDGDEEWKVVEDDVPLVNKSPASTKDALTFSIELEFALATLKLVLPIPISKTNLPFTVLPSPADP